MMVYIWQETPLLTNVKAWLVHDQSSLEILYLTKLYFVSESLRHTLVILTPHVLQKEIEGTYLSETHKGFIYFLYFLGITLSHLGDVTLSVVTYQLTVNQTYLVLHLLQTKIHLTSIMTSSLCQHSLDLTLFRVMSGLFQCPSYYFLYTSLFIHQHHSATSQHPPDVTMKQHCY